MITRIYMKWVPLLVISGGAGISAELDLLNDPLNK